MRTARLVEATRIAYGAGQLAVPERLAALAGCRPSPLATTLMRVLGTRHVLQGVLLLAVDAPAAHRVGSAIDALHAASLIPLGRLAHGDDTRLAAIDGGVASLLSVLETRLR